MATTHAKICIACGRDCADRPRVRDPQGRYVCRECVARGVVRVQEGVPGAAAGAGVRAPGTGPGPKPSRDDEPVTLDHALESPSASEADDQPIALAPGAASPPPASAVGTRPRRGELISSTPPDDSIPLERTIPVEAPPEPERALQRPTPRCPSCTRPVPEDAHLCTHCGYDMRRGVRVKSKVDGVATPAGPACANCGYELTGLSTGVCPECGTKFSVSRLLRKFDYDEDSRRATREAYRTPIIMAAVAVPLAAALTAVHTGDALDALAYLIGFAIEVPVGVGAFWLCCVLMLGFDAPMRLTAVRLAGIYAVVDAVHAGLALTPVPLIPWLAAMVIYIGLLMSLLELDVQDAIVVALVTFIVKLMLALTVDAFLLGLL